MASEISGNSGYLALGLETTPGVAVTPTVTVPLYNETLSTDHQHDTNNAAFGSKAARLVVIPGIRAHNGDFEVMAEPNTTQMFYDMLLTRGSVTGSNPYTWPFTAQFGATKSYTIDISLGNQVSRFVGVMASEISPVFSKNEMHWKVTVSALKSFLGAEVANVSTTTVTLKTPVNYPSPTDGLVVGDLVSTVSADGATRQNFTIASLTATTVTLSAAPTGVVAGDSLILRPATPAITAAPVPFLWSRTEFRFGADATSALNATHTPLEDGSTWTVSSPFDDDKGEDRSGSFDPASLARSKSVDATFSAKKFFSSPDEVRNFTALKKVACVIRCFSGASNECRITLNNLTITKGGDKPLVKVDETLYYEMDYTPAYDFTDGQMFDVKVINTVAGS